MDIEQSLFSNPGYADRINQYGKRGRKMKKIFVLTGILLLLAGCYSVKHISSEAVLGKWQMYVADTGRNGTEQMQPLTYTFMPDGSYVSCLTETTPEETTGKWEIKDGKLLLTGDKNNVAVYTYSNENGHTFSHTAYDKSFFPKGVTFILRRK